MAGERALPGLGLFGFWTLGSNGWKDQNDANLRKLSALVQPRALSLEAAVPGTPTDGNIHVLTAGANANDIAVRDLGAWVYLTPSEGWLIYVVAESAYYRFTGTSWVCLLPLPTSPADVGRIWAVASDEESIELIDPPAGGGGGGGGTPTSFVAVTANYTLLNSDLAGGVIIRVNSASTVTILIPTGLSNIEPVTIIGVGAGDVIVAPDTGVTLLSADGNTKLRARYSGATLVRDGSNNYMLIGDLA